MMLKFFSITNICLCTSGTKTVFITVTNIGKFCPSSGLSSNFQEYLEWVNEWLAKKAYSTRVFSVASDFKSGVIFAVIIELVGELVILCYKLCLKIKWFTACVNV